jgi:predicted O-methyltransferase YrrM
VGYSAITIASHMPEEAVLCTIEIDAELAAEAEQNVAISGLAGRIRVLTGDALDLIPDLQWSFGFAFVYTEKSECKYLALIVPKLCCGALVVADNAGIFESDMKGYMDLVRSSRFYESRYVSVGRDGIVVSRWHDGA